MYIKDRKASDEKKMHKMMTTMTTTTTNQYPIEFALPTNDGAVLLFVLSMLDGGNQPDKLDEYFALGSLQTYV